MAELGVTTYEPLPAGVYLARCVETELQSMEYNGKPKTQLAMRWELEEPDYEGRSIRTWATFILSPGNKPSKLYTWCSVLFHNGKPIPPDWRLNTDSFVGVRARLVVEVRPDNGYNRVEKLLPARNGRQAAPAPAVATQLQPRQPATSVLATTPTTERDEPPDYVDAEELPF